MAKSDLSQRLLDITLALVGIGVAIYGLFFAGFTEGGIRQTQEPIEFITYYDHPTIKRERVSSCTARTAKDEPTCSFMDAMVAAEHFCTYKGHQKAYDWTIHMHTIATDSYVYHVDATRFTSRPSMSSFLRVECLDESENDQPPTY